MKSNSYGIFDIEIQDAEGKVLASTKAFNDVTYVGLEHVFFSKSLEQVGTPYPTIFQYVKVGTDATPTTKDMTDLGNPVLGYWSPAEGIASVYNDNITKLGYSTKTEDVQLNGRNSTSLVRSFSFGRSTLPAGTYTEIGLFTHDPDTLKPVDMVCRAVFKTPLTITDSQYIMLNYTLRVNYGEPRAWLVDVEGEEIHCVSRYSEYRRDGYNQTQRDGETDIRCYGAVNSGTDGYIYPGVVKVTTYDEQTSSRILLIEFTNATDFPIKLYGYRLLVGDIETFVSSRLPITIPANKKGVYRVRQSLSYGFQRIQAGESVTPLFFVPPTNLNASAYNPVDSYGASRVEFYVGEQLIASGTADETRAITSWSSSNTTMYSNNYVVNFKTFDAAGKEYPGYSFVPSSQVGSQIYPTPYVNYTYATRQFSFSGVPSSVTHIRVFAIGDESITIDLPIGTTSHVLPESFNGYLSLGARWVGSEGIGNITSLTVERPVSYFGMVKNADGTKFRMVIGPRSSYFQLRYRQLRGGQPYDTSMYIYDSDLQTKDWHDFPENFVQFYDVPIATDADGRVVELRSFTKEQMPVYEVIDKVTDFIPFEDIATAREKINPPYALYVDEPKSKLSFKSGHTGTYRIYTRGDTAVAYEGTAVKDELITLAYRDLFEVSSRGELRICSVENDVESLAIQYVSYTLGSPDDLIDMEYDPVSNVLKGKVGYNTAFVSIRRWLVSQLDISLSEGQTEFEIPLSISLDPSARYEVYALSADGKHSANPFTIYPENSDALEEPIYDIEKPSSFEEYIYENYQNGLAGVRPNLAKYGAESFSGTFYDETIMTSSVEEVVPGRWKCEFSTRNWKYKYQLYDGHVHDQPSSELTLEGYPPTAPAPNGPYHFRCTMWSTWLRYSWDGFDAFLRSSNIREPFRQSDNPKVGVTVNQATGYYRMVVDSYRWNNLVGSGVLIFDFTDVNKDLPIEQQLTDRIGHNFRTTYPDSEFDIYINGVKATVTRSLAEDGTVEKFTISTPEYTYESPQGTGEYWKLISNTSRIDDPDFADEIIKIEIGSRAFDQNNSYYLRNDGTGFNFNTESGSSHYGAFVYSRSWNGWVTSWCYYVRPYVSKKPLTYNVPSLAELDEPVIDFSTQGNMLTGVKYLINGEIPTVDVTEYYEDGNTPKNWVISYAGNSVEVNAGNSLHRVSASPDGAFVLAIVNATEDSGGMYYYGGEAKSFSGESAYRESYYGYAFPMSVDGASSAPLAYQDLTLPPVDMNITNTMVSILPEVFNNGAAVYIDGEMIDPNHNGDQLYYDIPGDAVDTALHFVEEFQYGENTLYYDDVDEAATPLGWTVEITAGTRQLTGTFGDDFENDDYNPWIESRLPQISEGLVRVDWVQNIDLVKNPTDEDLVLHIVAFQQGTNEAFSRAILLDLNNNPIDPQVDGYLYEFIYGPGVITLPFNSYYSYINGVPPEFCMWVGEVEDPTTLPRYASPWEAFENLSGIERTVKPGGPRLVNNTNIPVTLHFIPGRAYESILEIGEENSTYVFDDETGEITVTLYPDNGARFVYDSITTNFMFVSGSNAKYVITLHDSAVQQYSSSKFYMQNAIKGNGVVGVVLKSSYHRSHLSAASFVIDSAPYFIDPADAGILPYAFPELSDGRFVYVRPTANVLIASEFISHLLIGISGDLTEEIGSLELTAGLQQNLTATIDGVSAEITATISGLDTAPMIFVKFSANDIEITQTQLLDTQQMTWVNEPFTINKEFVDGDLPVVFLVSPQTTRLSEVMNVFVKSDGSAFTRTRENANYKRVNESIFSRETLLINFGYNNGVPVIPVDNSFQINVAPDSFGAEIIFSDSGVRSDRSVGSQMPDLWSGRFTVEDFAVRVNGVPAQLVYGGATLGDGRFVSIDSPAFNGRLPELYGNQNDNGPMMMSMSDGETEAQFDYTADNGLFIICGEQVFAYSPFSLYGWYLVNGVGGYYQIEIRGPSIGYLSDMPAFTSRPYPDSYNGDTVEWELGNSMWYGRPNDDGLGGYVVTGDVIVPPPMVDGPPPEIPEDAEGATVQEYTYTAVLTPPCVDGISVVGKQPDLSKFLLPIAPVIGVDTTVVQMGLTQRFNEFSWFIDGESAWFDEDYNFPGDGNTQSQIGFDRDIYSPAPQMWYALDDLDGDGIPRKPPGGANNDYSSNIYRLTNGITSLFYDTRTCTWYQDGEADGMHTVTYSMIAPPGADVSDVSIATMWGTQNAYVIPNNAFVSTWKESDWSYMCYGGFHIGHSVSEVTSETIPNTLLDYTYDSANVPLFTWTDVVVNYVPNWRQHGLDAYEFSIGGRVITPTIILGERDEAAESGMPDNNVTKILIQDDVTGYGVYFVDDPGNNGICAYVKDGRFDDGDMSNFNQLVHRNIDLDSEFAQYVGTLGGGMPPPPMASLMSFSLDGEEGEFIPNELPENVASQTFIGPRLRDKEAMGQRTSFVPTHDVSILVKCKEAFPVNAIPTAFVGDMNTYVAQSNGEVAFHADVGAEGKYLSALYILPYNWEGIAYNAHRMFGESDVSEFDRYNAYGDELRLSRPQSGGGGGGVS